MISATSPAKAGRQLSGCTCDGNSSQRVAQKAVELAQDGDIAFRGRFTFVVLDRTGAEQLLGGPLPEAWQRFCRSSS